MFEIFVSVLVIMLVVSVAGMIICSSKNNKIYCYIFEHKQWKLWKTVCKRLPYAKFDGHYLNEEKPYLECYNFYIHDIGIGAPVLVVYWVKSGEVSVHNLNLRECVLSSFDKYHSDKARNIIKGMIEEYETE